MMQPVTAPATAVQLPAAQTAGQTHKKQRALQYPYQTNSPIGRQTDCPKAYMGLNMAHTIEMNDVCFREKWTATKLFASKSRRFI
jgi:hypothetical protein